MQYILKLERGAFVAIDLIEQGLSGRRTESRWDIKRLFFLSPNL